MQQYYQQIGVSGDLSYLNLPQKPITTIPKLIDIMVNGMINRDYSVVANSVDLLSVDKKSKYRKLKEEDMIAKPFLEKAKSTLNIDVSNFPGQEIPETDEELEMHFNLEYKPSIELSEEQAIYTIFNENRFKIDVEPRLRRDLVECGVAWAKHSFIPNKGIVLEYVDAANKIQSYSDFPGFNDCYYHGEFKTVLISDVRIDYPWINDYPDLLAQLDYSGTNWWDYYRVSQKERIRGTTNLLYFTYKTTRERANKIKTKKTGEKILSKADEKFDESSVKKNDYKRISVVDEVEFEGVMVLGTSILLKWEVCENMVKSKSNKKKVISQYVGFAPEKQNGFINSALNRMIPIADMLNVLELKAVQIIQKISPDGYSIDIDGLAEIDLGDGKVLTPQQHFDMLTQTGSVFTRSYGASGDFNAAKNPITELRTGDSLNKLVALRNERNGYLEQLREVIGLNSGIDATMPDKDSLVGLQKMAAYNSNVATKHILNGGNDIITRIAQATSYRISDLLQYSELKEDLIRQIGSTSVKDLESVKDLPLADFAIFLQLSLDDEEKAKLENDLSVAVEKGYISIPDKYKIINIPVLKYAVSYLSILIKKREKNLEEQKKREFEYQSEQNIKASQAAEQMKQQTTQMELQAKMQLQDSINNAALEKVKLEGIVHRQNLELEWSLKDDNQRIINEGMIQKTNVIEDNKDKRVDMQASRQSALITQRQRDENPRDFEAENEELEMFDLD